MDLRKVKKLIELFEESGLIEMEITEGESTIRLNRGGQMQQPAMNFSYSTPSPGQPERPASPGPVSAPESTPEKESGTPVNSPMVGTFYDSSSPDAEPYVKVGTVVKPGDVLCIIEAMKTFNQFEAEQGGTIKAIYKTSGDPVEFGEPLFLID